ncbi:MAG: type I restriction enzyme HsdR N-terminal domain-containing protein [Dysgonamonadaceae bacterium]|jgi:hypothetical protein|nr:type I restriction enzyme HsdR N-terminal domain-containing protein [Dysgonamonadaceae bacterium]
MSGLNLPPLELRTREQDGKQYVFDRLKRRYTRLTPEEYVRQHFINYLIEYKKFPESLLANEIQIELGNIKKRCDTVLYDKFLKPVLIIEYKSPKIAINQDTFDQISRYNMKLQVPWLIVSNGLQHYCCKVDFNSGTCSFLNDIPDYDDIYL